MSPTPAAAIQAGRPSMLCAAPSSTPAANQPGTWATQ